MLNIDILPYTNNTTLFISFLIFIYLLDDLSYLFQTSNVSVYKQMWEFMEATSQTAFVNGNLEGWNKVLEGKGEYAFLLESTSNDYRNQQKPCKTMKVGHNLNQYGIGIATKQGSELR